MAYIDNAGLNYLAQKITNKMSVKVDKVEGKNLSSNDYDNDAVAEVAKVKDKVDIVPGMGLSSNDYDDVAVAEVAKIANKADSNNPTLSGAVTVPTVESGTSDGTAASTKFVDNAITDGVADITSFEYKLPQDGVLPATGEKGYVYLIPNTGHGTNVYDEYIWIGSRFELFGTTEMDLSGYILAENIVPITNADIDAAFGD